MLYANDRDRLRGVYCDVWQKHREGQPLEAMEALIRDVILDHGEYRSLLEDRERALGDDFPPELGRINPFLHMSLHLAIREQLATDRPPGIRAEYQRLLTALGNAHEVEHRIMECLGTALHEAQRSARGPDDAAYLACIQSIARG